MSNAKRDSLGYFDASLGGGSWHAVDMATNDLIERIVRILKEIYIINFS